MNIYLGSPGKFESLILHDKRIFTGFYKCPDFHKKVKHPGKKVVGPDLARPG
jgi:hypothetical protein